MFVAPLFWVGSRVVVGSSRMFFLARLSPSFLSGSLQIRPFKGEILRLERVYIGAEGTVCVVALLRASAPLRVSRREGPLSGGPLS